MKRRPFLLGIAGLAGTALFGRGQAAAVDAPARPEQIEPVRLSEAEWREQLSPHAFRVLRKEATEQPNSSPLNFEQREGTYHCAGCGLVLFRSEWKFKSGTGWPSFYDVIEKHIGTKQDGLLMFTRTEYHCARCGGHHGHVFEDGPEPTGLRYCNNGVALEFRPSSA